MEKSKRQHTVPRFYLERWVDPSTGNVSVFDKFSKKVFQTTVWNIAQERYFYDLNPEAIKPEFRNAGIDPQIGEKALAIFEGYFARTLDALLGRAEPIGIHPDFRRMLAFQVAIQWMRTKRHRESIVELSNKVVQAQADELVRRKFPDLPKSAYPKVTVADHYISALHTKFLFDQDHWERIAGVFRKHIWLLGVNETATPFYTSDHPVVRRSNVPDDKTGGIGIESPGVEFFMPLTPGYGLVMLERSFFRTYEKYDGGLAGLGPEKVEELNRLQVEQSYRHVFSSTADFALARKVCAENPSVCDPNRQTTELEVTQVGPMRTRFEARVRP